MSEDDPTPGEPIELEDEIDGDTLGDSQMDDSIIGDPKNVDPFREVILAQSAENARSDYGQRPLPHSKDAEMGILAAILQDRIDLMEVLGLCLSPTDFFRSNHQRIFKAMRRLKARGIPIEFVTVAIELDRVGELDEVGGRHYLEAVEKYPAVENVKPLVRTIQNMALLRKLIWVLNRGVNESYDAERSAREIYLKILTELWQMGPKFFRP